MPEIQARPEIEGMIAGLPASAASATGGDLVLMGTEPVNGGTIFLNDPIALDFSNEIDIDSASLTTVQFLALDLSGQPSQDLVTGNFLLGTSPGDAAPGRRLLFVPRLPTNNTFSNGGFKSGRTYLCQLVGGSAHNQTVLRDRDPGWTGWDWGAGRQAGWHPVDPARPIVVEGCGALSRANRALATFGIWVELPAAERRRRALEREPDFAPHWREWAAQERAHAAAEHPRALADVIVEGRAD